MGNKAKVVRKKPVMTLRPARQESAEAQRVLSVRRLGFSRGTNCDDRTLINECLVVPALVLRFVTLSFFSDCSVSTEGLRP